MTPGSLILWWAVLPSGFLSRGRTQLTPVPKTDTTLGFDVGSVVCGTDHPLSPTLEVISDGLALSAELQTALDVKCGRLVSFLASRPRMLTAYGSVSASGGS